jgi:hypothetical protein
MQPRLPLLFENKTSISAALACFLMLSGIKRTEGKTKMPSINRNAMNLAASAAYVSTVDMGARKEPDEDSRRRGASYVEANLSARKPNSKRPDGVIVTISAKGRALAQN